jgi:hypothetical protein
MTVNQIASGAGMSLSKAHPGPVKQVFTASEVKSQY